VYNRAYINERVPFNVLSAVLERPLADGILCMLTYTALIRDPHALVYVDNILDYIRLVRAAVRAVTSWDL
jgi:hypothetical protein